MPEAVSALCSSRMKSIDAAVHFPSLPAEDRIQCGCGFLSSFVGEEVDRSDLDAVREELLSTDSPTLIGMED